MNDGGICRTAPATPGLLISLYTDFFKNLVFKEKGESALKLCKNRTKKSGKNVNVCPKSGKISSPPPPPSTVISLGATCSLKQGKSSSDLVKKVSAEKKSLRLWYLQKKSLCGFGICGFAQNCVTPL